MNKRIISITLVFAIIIAIIGIKPIITNDNTAKAEELRNGYSLMPTKYDGTGIDIQTSFIFKTTEDLAIETVKDNFKIKPEMPFEVEETNEGYIINPTLILETNSLYTFTFMETTWTFQTMSTFKVMGTLPANQTSNVPINTGIEMIFNYEGAKLQDYFQIEPKAEGTFENHGKTVVFVPKGLKEKTLYTITLKAGLSLDHSNQKLLEDYTFSFETGQEKEQPYIEPKGYFNFNNIINEFSLEEAPMIPMSYSVYDTNSQGNIKATVYAYSSIEAFAEAIEDYSKAPYWAYYAFENSKLKINNLDRVMTFEQPISFEYSNQQFLNLPEKLNAGFYLVDCTWEDIHFQTLIQVTNLSYYFVDSESMNLLWINDLSNDKPINNAIIKEKTTNKTYSSNVNGIVELPNSQSEDGLSIYYIESGEQSALVLNQVPYHLYWNNNDNSSYWRYLQTDRNLYMPDDKVKFWGFIKNRYEDEKIDTLDIEINTMNWLFYDSWGGYRNEVPFVSTTTKVDNGFYNGELRLPNLEPGNYQIEVKHKGNIVSSTYIQVEKYVKPEYRIEVSSNKNAIFANDSITFTTKTSFFEGTPVSNIKANYNIYGLDYVEGELQSDVKGEAILEYKAPYIDGYQGLNYINMNTYATLPESGQIYSDLFVKVFMNDINVKLETSKEDTKGTINVEVNKIVLDKLNDAIDDNDDDYLGEAVSNHTIKGSIYKNEWKKSEIGEYYDFINKIVVTQYEYYTEKTKLKDINIITDKDGKGQFQIDLPNQENCYFTAELTATDLSGHTMTFDQYFGESWYYNPGSIDRYYLKSDKEKFDLGEKLEVEFLHNDTALPEGNYLYITAQNGIKHYETLSSSVYSTEFDEKFFPNAELIGVYFNGKTYVQGESFTPRFDIENNRITFSATTDKETYKPGETVTVSLNATIYSKEEQKTIGAKGVVINISIVDEALFELSDQNINTLESLYEWVSNGINFQYASHKNEGYGFGRPIIYGLGGMKEEAVTADTAMAKEMSTGSNGQGAVRSEFRDTAYFASVALDNNGKGTFTFNLPDNVTSWRMTFAGISETLKAGTNTQELIVTLPYFINTSLNTTFLEGDQPFIGVSTYGSGLNTDEIVTYEVTCKENNYKATASGKAFERTNIPLFEMKEGKYTIIVRSTSSTGYTDAIEKQITVYKTYHQKQVADYYKLSEGLTLTTNDFGMTRFTFVDEGKGKFMPKLYDLSYSWGKRIDQKYIASLARDILKAYYGIDFEFEDEVILSDYQMEDGGFGILPYADSDLETTIKILPLIKDSINKKTISTYLKYMYESTDNQNKAMALYGLALLEEPVLLELEKTAQITNLSIKEKLYLSMAFAVIGDEYKAKEVYKASIKPLLEEYDQMARLKYGSTEDEYLEYTALAMVLASYLNLEEKETLFTYVRDQYSKEILTNSEVLTYIINEIKKVEDQELEVDYIYDGKSYSIKLDHGWPQTITFPSSKMEDFKIEKLKGEGALVAIYDDQFLENINNDLNLSANRTYYNYYSGAETKSFLQSDIVKVEINWNIEKTAIDDGYILTDYVPSGLKPIENAWDLGLKTDDHYWYRDIDGQKVSFYIYEYDGEHKPLYYYARVVAPGEYKAEGLLIQGTRVQESLWLGDKDTIIIEN